MFVLCCVALAGVGVMGDSEEEVHADAVIVRTGSLGSLPLWPSRLFHRQV